MKDQLVFSAASSSWACLLEARAAARLWFPPFRAAASLHGVLPQRGMAFLCTPAPVRARIPRVSSFYSALSNLKQKFLRGGKAETIRRPENILKSNLLGWRGEERLSVSVCDGGPGASPLACCTLAVVCRFLNSPQGCSDAPGSLPGLSSPRRLPPASARRFRSPEAPADGKTT